MTGKVSHDGSEVPPPEGQDRKLRYEKPALRCEGAFETMALSCAKIGTAPGCEANMKSS